MKNQKTIPTQKNLLEIPPEPFANHLHELRLRVLFYLAFLILGSIIGYIFHRDILQILMRPLGGPIFYSSPAGAFDFTLKISLFFGFIFSLPVLIYQILKFAEPALPKKISGLMVTSLLASSTLLIIGMSFAYFISLPAALLFLNQFSTEQIKSLISTTEYLNFVTRYLLGFGVVFQLPLIILIINSIKKIPLKTMLQYERWVVVIAFIMAAILTPTPDIFNQIMMAAPLILLYQITILAVWFVNKFLNPDADSYILSR